MTSATLRGDVSWTGKTRKQVGHKRLERISVFKIHTCSGGKLSLIEGLSLRPIFSMSPLGFKMFECEPYCTEKTRTYSNTEFEGSWVFDGNGPIESATYI